MRSELQKMNKNKFTEKVQKQLWFLNRKEKDQLKQKLNALDENQNVDFNKPIKFSNQYLKDVVFKEKTTSSGKIFILLIRIVLAYAVLLGLFLLGLITSLAAVHYFINPKVALSSIVVVLIIVVAIIIMILSLYWIKIATALFTKKLLELKFNRS